LRAIWLLVLLLVLSGFVCPIYAAGESPPKMLGQRMIYDPVGQRIILFGGSYYSGSYTFYGDTWSYDVAKAEWTKLTTTGSPNARFNHAMVYDSDRKEIVVFGGFSYSDRVGDTWVYNIASNTWTNVTPDKSPSRRSDPGAAYDAKNKKVILFGGYGRDDVKCEDTWAYDSASNTWAKMNPATHPQARYGGVMVYDSYTEKCLLFGGHMVQTTAPYNSLGYENEIWAYDYAADNWEKIPTTTKPPARYWHELAYDPEGNRIILFGGSQGGGNDLSDTWIYSCREAKWTQVSSTVSPSMRSQPSMAYDMQTKRTFMFGGADFTASTTFTYYNDIWVLDQNNQWKQAVAKEQPTTPVQPVEQPSGVPGFQSMVVAAGIAVAVAALLITRRR
jgi:N-acetylneuraminic acid mutarotase